MYENLLVRGLPPGPLAEPRIFYRATQPESPLHTRSDCHLRGAAGPITLTVLEVDLDQVCPTCRADSVTDEQHTYVDALTVYHRTAAHLGDLDSLRKEVGSPIWDARGAEYLDSLYRLTLTNLWLVRNPDPGHRLNVCRPLTEWAAAQQGHLEEHLAWMREHASPDIRDGVDPDWAARMVACVDTVGVAHHISRFPEWLHAILRLFTALNPARFHGTELRAEPEVTQLATRVRDAVVADFLSGGDLASATAAGTRTGDRILSSLRRPQTLMQVAPEDLHPGDTDTHMHPDTITAWRTQASAQVESLAGHLASAASRRYRSILQEGLKVYTMCCEPSAHVPDAMLYGGAVVAIPGALIGTYYPSVVAHILAHASMTTGGGKCWGPAQGTDTAALYQEAAEMLARLRGYDHQLCLDLARASAA